MLGCFTNKSITLKSIISGNLESINALTKYITSVWVPVCTQILCRVYVIN